MSGIEQNEIPESVETAKSASMGKSNKIAITTNGKTMDDLVSGQFGRCQNFLIVDPETMEFEVVSNTGEQMQSGAGPKAAELIINKGADILLTVRVGGNAEAALKRGGVKIVDGFDETMKIKDAVDSYLSKK